MNEIAARLGEVGLPEPLSELAARDWDAVVVGGGHNGLTAAAYLARAGSSVLVLERRERLGGACTLERPFPDERFVVSPCAYVVGLLDELVISELDLRRRGFQCFVADPNLWVPFEDGTAFGQWLDDERTERNLRDLGVVPKDIEGYWAYEHLFDEIRRKLRTGARDTWVGETPTRAEIEELLGGEQTMLDVVFERLDRRGARRPHERPAPEGRALRPGRDRRLRRARRTPARRRSSSCTTRATSRARAPCGATSRAGWGWSASRWPTPRARRAPCSPAACRWRPSSPSAGVVLEDGTRIRARTVLCNADPKVALSLLEGQDVPDDYRRRLEDWKVRSPVVKFNAALNALPDWTAAPGETLAGARDDRRHRRSRGRPARLRGLRRAASPPWASARSTSRPATTRRPRPRASTCSACSASTRPTSSPRGRGTAAARRSRASSSTSSTASRPASSTRIEAYEVLGPPDIEHRIGLTGGNIFQGEVTPGPDVGAAPHAAHAGGGPLLLRRRDAPRRAASSPSTAATPPWPSSPTSGSRRPRDDSASLLVRGRGHIGKLVLAMTARHCSSMVPPTSESGCSR